jgi:3',5'-cyclic AMP phosphodiesterase CpdA
MRLAITADLHWGISPKGDRCTERLAQRVMQLAPDVLILLGGNYDWKRLAVLTLPEGKVAFEVFR